MSAAPRLVTAQTSAGAPARPPPRPAGTDAPALARRLAARIGNAWLPRLAWSVQRTGRPGLLGLALLVAAALFLFSTYRQVADEVVAVRAELQAAQGRAAKPAGRASGPVAALRPLPARADMPEVLRRLFSAAAQAQLRVDAGKYELKATASGGLIRFQILLPVTGPYPQIRSFIDATLASLPAVALGGLALERKSIGDASVEAQIRLTVYTVPAVAPDVKGGTIVTASLGPASPGAPAAGLDPKRVTAAPFAGALFAPHSWYVAPPPLRAPPPPPPPPPPAAPEPTAPPLPYAFMGSFAPRGEHPVYFLSRGDRMIDAHVGDKIDGQYLLESAGSGQLVFVYLPMNVRQTLAAGGAR